MNETRYKLQCRIFLIRLCQISICQLPFRKKLFLKGRFAFTDIRNIQGNDKISGVLAYLRHKEPCFFCKNEATVCCLCNCCFYNIIQIRRRML